MKKILIWYLKELENSGGPKGYFYNIYEYLKKNPCKEIVFLIDLINPIPNNKSLQITNSSFINRAITDIKQYVVFLWHIYHRQYDNIQGLNIDDFDAVHIHDIADYYKFRNTFPRYNGKVILTSHCPCPWSYERLSPYDGFVNLIRPYVINKECMAYNGADYIMFPCVGAREPYEVNLQIRKTFEKNNDKFFYVPSSILDFEIDESKIQKYSELGIPDNAFVITYFGRHNHIKGYDILKRVGEALLDKYPNLYFLCAGKGEIEPLNHPRWIELGFINNTHELLYQSDLYISCNRETYFDLVVLEIFRSSTKALLSATGGNNYFKELGNTETLGVDYFDINDFSDLISKVEKNIICKNLDPMNYKTQCNSNRELYLRHFTIEKYIHRYLNAICNILK